MKKIVNGYAIYGVRIPDDIDWTELEKDPGQCRNDGLVGYVRAGAYDKDMIFLAIKVEELGPGQYKLITRDTMFNERKSQAHWNDALNVAIGKLGLYSIDGPGWFFVVNEGADETV
jgi:hypothetical protein